MENYDIITGILQTMDMYRVIQKPVQIYGGLQMTKEIVEEQRERLHSLLSEKADYAEILKVSQELDEFIAEFISQETRIISEMEIFGEK